MLTPFEINYFAKREIVVITLGNYEFVMHFSCFGRDHCLAYGWTGNYDGLHTEAFQFYCHNCQLSAGSADCLG